MGELNSWEDLSAEITRLYDEKSYAEAEAVIVEHGDRFPDRRATILYTRMCLAALLGEHEQALSCFSEALNQDFWYRTAMLRGDPDLASLQGNPGFERMTKVSYDREQAAQTAVVPVMAVSKPEQGNPPFPALVALHGNNSSTAITHPYWQGAAAGGFVVATPQSNQVAGIERYVWDEARQAERLVLSQIDVLLDEHPVDEKHMVLGGFSMGGRTACSLAIHGVVSCVGFIAVSPWLKGFEPWERAFDAAATRGLRGALIIGERDPGCYKDTLALHEMLTAHGVACTLTVIPEGRHRYPDNFDALLAGALKFVMSG